jgi:hypothetical protein
MTFNLRQLDNLSYDDVDPILNDYIEGAIDAFLGSPEATAHLSNYPEELGWIGTFVDLGYRYGEKTLSQMTQKDVQTLMEQTLPRKVTVLDPTEAEDAVPELLAFWQFLQREYNLRAGASICKYLESLAPQFPAMMMDPTRSGPAKAFIMMGHQSGFDMTTMEGMQAFQQEYNATLQLRQSDLMTQALSNMIPGGASLPSASPRSPSRPKPKGMGVPNPNSPKKGDRKKPNRKKK